MAFRNTLVWRFKRNRHSRVVALCIHILNIIEARRLVQLLVISFFGVNRGNIFVDERNMREAVK